MFRFSKGCFYLTMLFLAVEIFIAVFIHDKIIRPYIGDYLVVILVYCFFKTFLVIPAVKLALFVLLFSYTIEILQYFNFINQIGLKKSKFAHILFGNSFEWTDLLLYTLGILTVLIFENVRSRLK